MINLGVIIKYSTCGQNALFCSGLTSFIEETSLIQSRNLKTQLIDKLFLYTISHILYIYIYIYKPFLKVQPYLYWKKKMHLADIKSKMYA